MREQCEVKGIKSKPKWIAPSEMKRYALEEFYFSKEDRALKERLLQLVDGERGYPIHIYGSTGYGKTYLGQCLTREMIKHGKTAVVLNGESLMHAIIKAFGQQENLEEHFKELAELDLVVIDELEDIVEGSSFYEQTMKLTQWLTLQGVQVVFLTGVEKRVKSMKDREQTAFEARIEEYTLHMPEPELRKEYIDEVLGVNYLHLKKRELKELYQLDTMQKVYTYLENLIQSKKVVCGHELDLNPFG